ncbi:MAG: hypothetical protein ACHREM_02210 [Polyangiales bacterium]
MMPPKILAQKNTGNYEVALLEEDETYGLSVRYTGDWTGGEVVILWLDVNDPEDATKAAMRAWFRAHVRGDMNVDGLLARAGYDQYTNLTGKARSIRVP